jgi:hypothetical protein
MAALDAVQDERGVLATALQRSTIVALAWPRGLQFCNANTNFIKVPAQSSSIATRELYHGFLSLRVPHRLFDNLGFSDLFDAETTELTTAESWKDPTGFDGSALPRKVGATLLICGGDAACTTTHHAINAFAHLTSIFGTQIRTTILTGYDAERYVVECGDILTPPTDVSSGTFLAVRWSSKGSMVACMHPIDTSGLVDSIFCSMQHRLFVSHSEYGAPVATSIVSMQPAVPPDAWTINMKRATDAFFNTMEAPTSKTIAIECCHLASSGVLVRFVERHRGFEGVNDPSCFHGMLLAHHDMVDDAVKRFSRSEMMQIENNDMGLHTAATQVYSEHLGTQVSLFARGARAGTPIQSPGSWIFVFKTAIVPLEHVLPNFFIIPCARSSIISKNNVLGNAAVELMGRASSLVGSINKPDVLSEMAVSPRRSLQSSLSSEEIPLAGVESTALAAFGITPSSARLALGDALLFLNGRSTPEILAFIERAIVKWGSSTSLNAALGMAARAIHTGETANARATVRDADRARLKRLSDSALSLFQMPKRAKDVPTIRSDRFAHLLKAMHVSYDSKVYLAELLKENSEMTLLHDMFKLMGGPPTDTISDVLGHAGEVMRAHFYAPKHDDTATLEALAAAAHIMQDAGPKTMFLFHIGPTKLVTAHKLLRNGSLERVGPGIVLDTDPDSRALMVCGPRIVATIK